MPNQHNACKEDPVIVKIGEEFKWVTDEKECHVHMLKHHLLDSDDYDVQQGPGTPAKVIGPAGTYEFTCTCKGQRSRRTNPHIIVNP